MAKKKIHIDELFRRELGDMKMPVDTNDWAAMQTQIAAEQDKRKRRVFWWWFAGIALLLLVGASTTYYFLEANSQSDTIVTENTTSTPSIETPSKTETSSQNEIENSTLNQQTEEKEITSKNSENAASDRQVNSSTPSNKRETNGTKDNSVKEIKKKLDENKNNRNRKPKDDIKTDKNEGGNGKKTPTPTLNDKQQVSPKVTPKPDTTESNNNDTKDKTVTKIVSSDSTQTSGDSTKQAKQEKPPKKGKDGSKPKLSPFSLGFSTGGTSNSFTADENSNFGRILNNGNQSTLGFNALISANYAFNNFEINSGLGINSITNNGSYNYTHQTFDSIPILGPLGEIRGYFYVNFRDTSHSFNLTSSFTSITLPIGVSYNIKLNNNSGLRLGANTSINYLVGASGEYINPFNLFKLDVSNNKDLFRKWNLGLGASVGYYYSFKPQWTLETSINYNTLTNGIFDDRIGTAIRPSSIGINIGVRYNFKLRK